jgi:dipeptidyl aminopeptidase/acylaminoacyl peptidase
MTRKVTFTPQRFLRRIRQLGNFDVSPDGGRIAYSANQREQWTVYVREVARKGERVLLKSEQAVMNPEFSPDGRWVAVQSDFEGDENFNVYVVPTRGGSARKLTDTPADSASPRWSPDGGTIAFISNRDRDRENVFVVEVDGGAPRQLTHVDDIVSEIAWRPDGRQIAFSAGVGHEDWIGIVGLDGHMEKLVAWPDSESVLGGDVGRPRPFSPDGRRLAFISNVHDHLDVGVLDLETRSVRWPVRTRRDKSMPSWSPDGARLAFLENHDGNVRLMTADARGKGIRPVSPTEGVAARSAWHPDGRALFYQHSTSLQPYRLVLQRGNRRTTLVDSLRATLPAGELARAKLVWYRSFDGRRIPAWLYEPPKARSRSAAIVDPHGGPESQELNEWDTGHQFLVARGFTVLAPNYRGGTGYGRAWRKASDHDLGGADMQDIIAGGRWLLRTGRCPPGRLGIFGVSYGGYAVAHCLQRAPELWSVGVSVVGFFNWFTATSNERGNLQIYDQHKMGSAEADAGRFRKYSPFFYLDRIRVPVLFTGGAHDPRCPVTEARQIVNEMRRMGKTVDYLEFPDEGHSPRKTSNRVRLHDRAIAWFETYLPEL